MREVIIKYADGRQETYATVLEAAAALGCTRTSMRRMAAGIATRLPAKYGIESVCMQMPKGRNVGVRKKGRHRVLCTCEETGASFIANSMKDAQSMTNFPFSQAYFSEIVDKGVFCHGWKYDTLPTEKVLAHLEFKNDVSKETVKLIYGMAHNALRKYYSFTESMKHDVMDYVVVHVASDLSCGKFESSKYEKLNLYIWSRVKSHTSHYLYSELKWHDGQVNIDEKESTTTKESWMESLATTEDADMSIISDMPEHLRPLAECLMWGMSGAEVDCELGIEDGKRLALMREIKNWLREYMK